MHILASLCPAPIITLRPSLQSLIHPYCLSVEPTCSILTSSVLHPSRFLSGIASPFSNQNPLHRVSHVHLGFLHMPRVARMQFPQNRVNVLSKWKNSLRATRGIPDPSWPRDKIDTSIFFHCHQFDIINRY